LFEHNAIGLLEGEGVCPIGHEWGEEVMEEVRSHLVNSLPYRVGYRVRPWGRRQGGSAKCTADLFSR